MTRFEELPITKIGTLYFIPVNQSVRYIDMSDFDGDEMFSEPTLVTTSGHDQFHAEDGENHWVVVHVPASNNGEERNGNDVIGALDSVYQYLRSKDLVSDTDLPEVILSNPFSMSLQPA